MRITTIGATATAVAVLASPITSAPAPAPGPAPAPAPAPTPATVPAVPAASVVSKPAKAASVHGEARISYIESIHDDIRFTIHAEQTPFTRPMPPHGP
nr:hypothetical protein [Streptomyces albidoflavus]